MVTPSIQRVVVIGAGVLGCAAAYQIARSGFNVTLVERDAIAAHASGYNAGNLNPLHGTPPSLIPFALESFRLHQEVRAELAQFGHFNAQAFAVKRIHLGYDEADRRRLEETASLFKGIDGFSASWLDGDDLRRLEPRLAPDTAFGVVAEGNLAIDSYEFTNALAQAAQQLGANVVREAVSGVVYSGQRITGIRCGRQLIPCDEVVFATGPWVAETKSWLGIDLDIEPVKGQLLRMRMADRPAYDFTWEMTALYRRRGNELWVGGTMEKCGFDCIATAEARESLLDRAARIMPAIRDAELLDHVAALRPMTPSNNPIASRAQGWQNAYLANGGGQKGVLLSVGLARKICELLHESSGTFPHQTSLGRHKHVEGN